MPTALSRARSAPVQRIPDERTSDERALVARIASYESWARTADRQARTAPARAAFNDRFERQIDPDGVLPLIERQKRADAARKAHFSRMALKSAQSRRRAANARRLAATLDAEADAADSALAGDDEAA